METVVLKNRRTTLERAEKFISNTYFTDVNLRGRLFGKSVPVTSISHWAAPTDRYTSYEEAVNQIYIPTAVGQQFGPTWATHWFQVQVDVPQDWVGMEVRLRWNSGSEALVWQNGEPKQGLSSEYDRLDFPLTECLQKDELRYTVYVEMACNGMFGAGDNGMINSPNLNKQFTLACCNVAIFNRNVYSLLLDIELLYDMAKHLGEDNERSYQALYTVNTIINTCIVDDPGTYHRCLEIASKFLNQKNGDSQHTLYAMGHAHIDTAWLWPYSETVRKCARSWSCTIRLMEKYPDFTFTCSQAQQYEWVKYQYPSLYVDMKKYIAEGRFIPVGGTWVEMDGLIPSGESFVRQFLYGQRFFQQEFGIKCKEFWLPDTFGYSGQLPQVMRHCGISRFLTQKMSWNLVNKFPHHTFWWKGIDGTKVLTHFPPGDSYEMKGTIQEVLRTVKNFRDKGRSDKTAFLFGFGDGGNGPSEDMIERLHRMKNVDSLPKVMMSTPDTLFSRIEEEDAGKLCHWVGELYLELHNGTYTTHAKVKKQNRRCEILLHDVEFVNSVALVTQIFKDQERSYPQEELTRLWKLLLLNQFHDVLPGSSIEMVYKDAHRYYDEIVASAEQMVENGCFTVVSNAKNEQEQGYIVWNSQSWERLEVIALESDSLSLEPTIKKRRTFGNSETDVECTQVDRMGKSLYFVKVPSYGFSQLKSCRIQGCLSVKLEDNGQIVLKNDCLEAHVDKAGRVLQLLIGESKRNVIADSFHANQFILHDDIPLYWDAWDIMDYHLETRKPICTVISEAKVVDEGPLRVSVKFSLKISENSHIDQTVSLDVGSPYLKFTTQVVWNENRKLLKVEFPTSIHTTEAVYDIQYGHIKRPTHQNTTWDTARFEVCGHKWSSVSEYNYGVAILNDCKYGHSAVGNILRMSLLKSSKAPDNTADMGTHQFTYALMPYLGTFQAAGVIQQAYCFNSPLFAFNHKYHPEEVCSSFFSLGSPQVVLDNVKKSEDDETALILRLFESYGGECKTYFATELPFTHVEL